MALLGEIQLSYQASNDVEEEMIVRARRGDHLAWDALVRSHQEHVFRLNYLILQDAEEAKDAAQDTFVRAYLSLDSFDVGRPLKPWLTRISINSARNQRRALGRYLNHLRWLFVAEPEPERDLVGPEQAAQDRWQAERLWTAVRRLSPIRQEVVYLRYFLDMSEVDMVEALDVRPGTVKSRLHRALAELRQIIETDFPELKDLFK